MVQAVDLSGVNYVLPIIAFLLVAFLLFAFLQKLKLFGDSTWPTAFISFFVATFFITVVGSIDYVRYIGAWIAMLIVSVVFLLAILGMFGKGMEGFTKGVGVVAAVVGILIFLISGLVVYSSYINPYLPGGNSVGDSGLGGTLTEWVYSPRVGGAILLLIVSAIAAWILTKAK